MEGTDLTKTGVTSGTLFYAAPEQARGQAEARSDLWSLGVVLYEALTGHRPFEGSYEAATLYAILHEAPAPLPADTPEPLASVVMRLLEKVPEARFASAQEVERALTGGRLAPEASSRLSRRPWRGGAVGAALALLVLVSWVFWSASSARSLPDEIHLAILPFASPEADSLDAALADGLAPLITSELASVRPRDGALHLVPSSEVREAGVTRTSDVAKVLGATALVRGTFRRQGDSLAVEIEVVDATTSRLLASRIVGASGERPGGLVVAAVGVVSDALGLGADAVQLAARQATAPEAYGPYLRGVGYLEQPPTRGAAYAAVALFEEAAALDPRSPFVRAGLAQAVYRQFRLSYDVATLDRAEAEARRVIGLAGPRAPEAAALAHVTLASGAMERGRYPEAVEEARQAVVLAPRLDATRRTLGRAFEKSGRVADAERELSEAVALRPDSWMAQNTLGGFFFRQGRFGEAQAAFETAVQLVPGDATAHFNLGAALFNASGDAEAAIPHLETSIDIRPTPEALGNLAYIRLVAEDRPSEAAALYRQALAIDPVDAYSWGSLSSALEASGERDESRRALERAVEAARTKLNVNPNDASLLAFAATCNASLEQNEDAKRLIERALEHGRDDMNVLADAASTYQQIGDAPEARRWLRAASAAGFAEEWVREDSVLNLIR